MTLLAISRDSQARQFTPDYADHFHLPLKRTEQLNVVLTSPRVSVTAQLLSIFNHSAFDEVRVASDSHQVHSAPIAPELIKSIR